MRPPDGSSSSSGPHGKHELQPEVVLYTASRRRGRTSADLYALRALLRGYGLTMEERDVSTSKAHRSELKSLLAARGCAFSLPQLLVGGRPVGGPDDVRKLHHTGGLRPLLDGAPRPCRAFVCQACKRVGSEPCPECSEARNKMLDHGVMEQQQERVVLFYPTQDVSMEGKREEMEAPLSVSLGAMGPLLNKLDMMLGPQGCKLTKGLHDRFHLLKINVEEISAYLEDLLEVEDPPMAVKCWMKEAQELSYDILDYIDRVSLSLECRSVKMGLIKITKLKWQKQIEYAVPRARTCYPKTICVDVIRAPVRLKWYQQIVEKVSEFRIYAMEAIRRYLIIVDDLWDTSAWDVINQIALGGLSVNDVDILRGLPALTALSLYVKKSPNVQIIFGTAAGFTALKYLKLRFMSGIAWLRFEADAMPNLWKLRLVFDAIPQMDQRLELYSKRDQWKQYRHGNALISIEHMTGLREVSAKFGGAAADLEYVSRTGIVSNHLSNPIIEVKLVDSGSHGDKKDIIEVTRVIFAPESSRRDYGASIASLNREFNSVVRNGDIYRLRRKNGVAEHWLYLSCGNNPPEWDAYDPSTGRWIQVPKMPPSESYFGADRCRNRAAGVWGLRMGYLEI
ncbi:hypothetical protein ZWY2020_047436 [Hordeum vulgare]|nr:hypothetical protein ZWY2020_047436 [Hordeum vulgare]